METLGRIFVLLLIQLDFPLGESLANDSLVQNVSLSHYSEVHQAKYSIDTLLAKLRTDITTYERKYTSLEKMANFYRNEGLVKAKELKALKTVGRLLARLTGEQTSNYICRMGMSMYKVIRPIAIRTTSSVVPQGFTVKLQGIGLTRYN